jgi:hypothetical protein
MLVNDLANVLNLYLRVESSLGINDHNRTGSAKTEATGLNYLYLVSKTCRSDLCFHLLADGYAARRGTARTATNKHM